MIGGKFAPLSIMNNEDADIDSMITTFNIASMVCVVQLYIFWLFQKTASETASEIFGKHRQNEHWVTADILDQCDRRMNRESKDSNRMDLRNTGK